MDKSTETREPRPQDPFRLVRMWSTAERGVRRGRRGVPRSVHAGVCKPGHLELYFKVVGKWLRGLE